MGQEGSVHDYELEGGWERRGRVQDCEVDEGGWDRGGTKCCAIPLVIIAGIN